VPTLTVGLRAWLLRTDKKYIFCGVWDKYYGAYFTMETRGQKRHAHPTWLLIRLAGTDITVTVQKNLAGHVPY